MMFFSIFFSFISFKNGLLKVFGKKIFFFLIFVYIIVFFSLSKSKQNYGFNIIDRFLFDKTNIEGQSTIVSRFKLWDLAVNLGKSSPLLGVGLGNFLDYLPQKFKITYLFENSLIRRGLVPAYYNPHSIFFTFLSETGFISLLLFIFIIFNFFVNDLLIIIKSKNFFTKSIVFCFWSLFIFAVLNPFNSLRFFVFFWLYRFLIIFINKS